MNSRLLFFFFLLFCSAVEAAAGERKPEAYEKALLACKEGASRREIDDALKVLDADDAQMIFELARHLQSEAPAAESFQGPYMEADPKTGKHVLHKPTIGDVALMLISWKIVALSPGKHHPITVIDLSNVKDWIAARGHLTLREMQQDAAQEGVAKAKKHHLEHHDEFSLADWNLFQANLQALKLGKPPRYSSWVTRDLE